jgi:hypothetical protein
VQRLLPLFLVPLFLVILGCVLIYAGLIIAGMDFGSCPTMGFNGVTAPCFHYFPGTDIPITPLGDMISIIGGAIVAATLAILLSPYLAQKLKPSNSVK